MFGVTLKAFCKQGIGTSGQGSHVGDGVHSYFGGFNIYFLITRGAFFTRLITTHLGLQLCGTCHLTTIVWRLGGSKWGSFGQCG